MMWAGTGTACSVPRLALRPVPARSRGASTSMQGSAIPLSLVCGVDALDYRRVEAGIEQLVSPVVPEQVFNRFR